MTIRTYGTLLCNIMLHIFTIKYRCICTKYANQQMGLLRVAIMKPRVLLAVFIKCITQSLSLSLSYRAPFIKLRCFLNIFFNPHTPRCIMGYGRWLGEAYWSDFYFSHCHCSIEFFNSDGSQYYCEMENKIKMLRV